MMSRRRHTGGAQDPRGINMTDNRTIDKYFEQEDLTPRLAEITRAICDETGFILGEEFHRRFLYDRDKTWRVKYAGTFEERPAVLLVVGMKPEEDEEGIREAFRAQAKGTRVRPPHTYVHRPFDEGKGYGFMIEERVDAPPLFDVEGDPVAAARAFASFYRQLRLAVAKPFWDNEHGSLREFTERQAEKWIELAKRKHPEAFARVEPHALHLRDAMLAALRDTGHLQFMHAHLAPGDVRHLSSDEYVVFANHFWSWRQSAYDVAFAVWQQWMHLPVGRRTPEDVARITNTWRDEITSACPEYVRTEDLHAMLLNRLLGSLILDVPAKERLAPESPATVAPLYEAFVKEGKRLARLG